MIFIKEQIYIINVCKKKYPKNFLTIDWINIPHLKKAIPIGIFSCMVCGKPILHPQFNFGRACGSCDVGENNPKWEIKKPISLLEHSDNGGD